MVVEQRLGACVACPDTAFVFTVAVWKIQLECGQHTCARARVWNECQVVTSEWRQAPPQKSQQRPQPVPPRPPCTARPRGVFRHADRSSSRLRTSPKAPPPALRRRSEGARAAPEDGARQHGLLELRAVAGASHVGDVRVEAFVAEGRCEPWVASCGGP